MRQQVLILSLALLLVGCSDISNTESVNKTPIVEQQTTEGVMLASYFPPDGSMAYFQGEGNEFASFTLQTTYIDTQHIAQVEDNGGVSLLKIYRITDMAIELVYKEVVVGNPKQLTSQEVASLPVIETILQKPLTVGHHFSGWAVQSTTASIKIGTTDYRDVIQLTRTVDTLTTTKYFAKSIGLIRIEDTMVTNNEESFIITSTLQKTE